MSTETEIWDKQVLIAELEDIYALIDVCHSTLKNYRSSELESTEKVLSVSYNKLYEIIEIEQRKLKELEEVQS